MKLKVFLSVAFPVTISVRKTVDANFLSLDEERGLDKTVGRLVGGPIKAPGVTRKLRICKSQDWELLLVELANGDAIVVCSQKFTETPTLRTLNEVTKHQHLETIVSKYGISISLDGQVFGVVGLTSADPKLLKAAPKHWGKLPGDQDSLALKSRIMRQIITRIAIERTLLTWATRQVSLPRRIFRGAVIGFRVRRWPVSLLSDQKRDSDLVLELREQFNLPRVRKEILEQSRSWWTVVGVGLGVAGVTFSVIEALRLWLP